MKRRKLNSKISYLEANNPSSMLLPKLQKEVSLLTYSIKEEVLANLNNREQYAVSTIKSNPKHFFSYAKKFSK